MQRLRGQTLNIVLGAVALALVLIVVLTRGRVTTGEREARENSVLSAFRDKDITGIRFDRGGTRIDIERTALDDAGVATWRLRAPVQEEAEAYAMDKLLGSLEFASWVRRIKPDEVDRAGFGLDSPGWTLEIDMGEIRYTLKLGKESPTPQGAHYLELVANGAPGSGIGVVSRDLVTELALEVGDLRGRQLMPYLSSALARIVIEGKGGTRRFAKNPDERWRFDGMLGNLRVDREGFDAVLLQFARTKAEHFIEIAAARQALAAAGADKVRVTMIPAQKELRRGIIEVGGRCPKSDNDVVALRSEPDPLAACVPKSVMPGLTTPAEALLDESLFSLRKDEVEKLAVTRGKQQLELVRKGTAFVLRAPVKADVELEIGNQHLDAIASARGEIVENPDLAKLGLAAPSGRATLESIAESERKVVKETLEIGSLTNAGELHVRRSSDGAVLVLDRDTARLLAADATLLRKRRLLDFAPSELLTVELQSAAVHQRVRREPSGVYSLELPKGFDHDASLATTLVDVLGSLEAERWAASEDDGSFGLKPGKLTARITLETRDGGTTTDTLVVGSPAASGHYAKLESAPGVFILSRRTFEVLETLLLDRSVLMVAPDAADRIEIEHDGKKLVLERKGATFAEAGTNTGIDPARIAQLGEALASLRAEGAIHLGPARADEGFGKPELVVRVDPSAANVKPWTFRIGAGDSWQGTSIHYARRDGVDATYAIAKSKLRAITDLF